VNKKILITTLGLVGLVVLGVVAANAVKADSFDSSSPIIQRLVERFGLNENEVVSTFEEVRSERKETLQQSKEEKLNQAVTDGVITEEQKQTLQGRWEEKKAEHQQKKEESESWYEEQGIDTEALRTYGGFGMKGFGHGHWGSK